MRTAGRLRVATGVGGVVGVVGMKEVSCSCKPAEAFGNDATRPASGLVGVRVQVSALTLSR
ncbi:MAG: hypothetical protein QOH93_2744 [Chloroflexia bacterium]|nr:hypothetical protein [Chloroflexia bacterium]